MPGNPPPAETEAECLIGCLRQQRDGLRYATFGLSEEQIRLTPTVSSLSLGGLIKHAAVTERSWLDTMKQRPPSEPVDYANTFLVGPEETLASVTGLLGEVGAETDAFLAEVGDLGAKVLLPDAPWLPHTPDGYPLRWIGLHLVEELARHAGHADIIRESIDGATMYALMAGAEGWPETEWIKPWRPGS